MSRRNRVLLTGGSFVAAAALLFWSVRGIDWSSVAFSIRGADLRLVLLFLILGSVALFLRALRWRTLLNGAAAIPIPTVFWAAAAGYFGNNFLPARAGELVRTGLIRSRSSLTAGYIVATVAVERVADALVLLALAGAVLRFVPGAPAWLSGPAQTLIALSVAGAFALAIFPRLGRAIPGWIASLPIPAAWKPPLRVHLREMLRGLGALHQYRRFLLFAALTFAIWTFDAVEALVCGRALGLHFGLPLALLLIAAIGLGSALPAPPGYVGIYQFIAVSVLGPFGFTRTEAIAYIIFVQFLSYLVIGVWGGVGFTRLRQTRKKAALADRPLLP